MNNRFSKDLSKKLNMKNRETLEEIKGDSKTALFDSIWLPQHNCSVESYGHKNQWISIGKNTPHCRHHSSSVWWVLSICSCFMQSSHHSGPGQVIGYLCCSMRFDCSLFAWSCTQGPAGVNFSHEGVHFVTERFTWINIRIFSVNQFKCRNGCIFTLLGPKLL